jgi:hypothetical protein
MDKYSLSILVDTNTKLRFWGDLINAMDADGGYCIFGNDLAFVLGFLADTLRTNLRRGSDWFTTSDEANAELLGAAQRLDVLSKYIKDKIKSYEAIDG